jgi:hypothetical protein
MIVSLESNLPPDTYTVQWRTLSADDGHDGEGEFQFIVNPAAGDNADGAAIPPTPVEPTSATLAGDEAQANQTSTPGESTALPCLSGLMVGLVAVGLIRPSRGRRSG